MPHKRPTLSICIPAYNQAAYIGDAVETALSVDLAGVEVLVSDDASSDQTLERVAQFESSVRVLKNPSNRGMVGNWNHCLKQSRGRYIVLLSGDDMVKPSFLRRAVMLMETRPTIGLASGQTTYVLADGTPTGLHRPWSTDFVVPGQAVLENALEARGWNIIGNPSGVVLRREAAVHFDDRYRQFPDWAAWVDVLSRWDLLYLDEPACSYRRHRDQATHTNIQAHSARMELERLEILASIGTSLSVPVPLATAGKLRLHREAWKSAARLALRGSPRRAAWQAIRLAGLRGPLSLPTALMELMHDRLVREATRPPPPGSTPVASGDPCP